MPVYGKRTTTNSNDSTSVQPAPSLPDQQEFHQHLRELARGAIRILLEGVMREELDALIGAAWGKVVPSAKAIETAPTNAIWSLPLAGSRM